MNGNIVRWGVRIIFLIGMLGFVYYTKWKDGDLSDLKINRNKIVEYAKNFKSEMIHAYHELQTEYFILACMCARPLLIAIYATLIIWLSEGYIPFGMLVASILSFIVMFVAMSLSEIWYGFRTKNFMPNGMYVIFVVGMTTSLDLLYIDKFDQEIVLQVLRLILYIIVPVMIIYLIVVVILRRKILNQSD